MSLEKVLEIASESAGKFSKHVENIQGLPATESINCLWNVNITTMEVSGAGIFGHTHRKCSSGRSKLSSKIAQNGNG